MRCELLSFVCNVMKFVCVDRTNKHNKRVVTLGGPTVDIVLVLFTCSEMYAFSQVHCSSDSFEIWKEEKRA